MSERNRRRIPILIGVMGMLFLSGCISTTTGPPQSKPDPDEACGGAESINLALAITAMANTSWRVNACWRRSRRTPTIRSRIPRWH